MKPSWIFLRPFTIVSGYLPGKESDIRRFAFIFRLRIFRSLIDSVYSRDAVDAVEGVVGRHRLSECELPPKHARAPICLA